MPSFCQYELQKAIFQVLVQDAALTGMVNGVYDRVPQKTAFPYISLQRWETEDWASQTTNGMRHTVTLDVWSREGGQKQAAQVMARMHELLHDTTLAVSGQQWVMLRFLGSSVSLEDDGCTYRGQMRLRVWLHA